MWHTQVWRMPLNAIVLEGLPTGYIRVHYLICDLSSHTPGRLWYYHWNKELRAFSLETCVSNFDNRYRLWTIAFGNAAFYKVLYVCTVLVHVLVHLHKALSVVHLSPTRSLSFLCASFGTLKVAKSGLQFRHIIYSRRFKTYFLNYKFHAMRPFLRCIQNFSKYSIF